MRKWLALFENSIHHIDSWNDDDTASVQGYVVDTQAEQLDNWMLRYGVEAPEFKDMIRSRFKRVAFLNNINVEEQLRGQGIGNEMMDEFINESVDHGAEIILLVADIGESQIEGFDLIKWYEGFGFERVDTDSHNPLMYMVLDA